MRVVIQATDLPGRTWGDYRQILVALQVGREPHNPVPGDAGAASWDTEVSVIEREAGLDFRGPGVQGKPGERFLYLTWGELRDGSFSMFRRAKLMLDDLGAGAATASEAIGTLSLTDAKGAPLCARVKPGDITWTLT
jgi:hypothetical protein